MAEPPGLCRLYVKDSEDAADEKTMEHWLRVELERGSSRLHNELDQALADMQASMNKECRGRSWRKSSCAELRRRFEAHREATARVMWQQEADRQVCDNLCKECAVMKDSLKGVLQLVEAIASAASDSQDGLVRMRQDAIERRMDNFEKFLVDGGARSTVQKQREHSPCQRNSPATKSPRQTNDGHEEKQTAIFVSQLKESTKQILHAVNRINSSVDSSTKRQPPSLLAPAAGRSSPMSEHGRLKLRLLPEDAVAPLKLSCGHAEAGISASNGFHGVESHCSTRSPSPLSRTGAAMQPHGLSSTGGSLSTPVSVLGGSVVLAAAKFSPLSDTRVQRCNPASATMSLVPDGLNRCECAAELTSNIITPNGTQAPAASPASVIKCVEEVRQESVFYGMSHNLRPASPLIVQAMAPPPSVAAPSRSPLGTRLAHTPPPQRSPRTGSQNRQIRVDRLLSGGTGSYLAACNNQLRTGTCSVPEPFHASRNRDPALDLHCYRAPARVSGHASVPACVIDI